MYAKIKCNIFLSSILCCMHVHSHPEELTHKKKEWNIFRTWTCIFRKLNIFFLLLLYSFLLLDAFCHRFCWCIEHTLFYMCSSSSLDIHINASLPKKVYILHRLTDWLTANIQFYLPSTSDWIIWVYVESGSNRREIICFISTVIHNLFCVPAFFGSFVLTFPHKIEHAVDINGVGAMGWLVSYFPQTCFETRNGYLVSRKLTKSSDYAFNILGYSMLFNWFFFLTHEKALMPFTRFHVSIITSVKKTIYKIHILMASLLYKKSKKSPKSVNQPNENVTNAKKVAAKKLIMQNAHNELRHKVMQLWWDEIFSFVQQLKNASAVLV